MDCDAASVQLIQNTTALVSAGLSLSTRSLSESFPGPKSETWGAQIPETIGRRSPGDIALRKLFVILSGLLRARKKPYLNVSAFLRDFKKCQKTETTSESSYPMCAEQVQHLLAPIIDI